MSGDRILHDSPDHPGFVRALTDEHVANIIANSAGAVVNLAVEVQDSRRRLAAIRAIVDNPAADPLGKVYAIVALLDGES